MIINTEICEMGIIDVFERAVSLFSDRVALRDEKGELSYKELAKEVKSKALGLKNLLEWHEDICVAMDLPKSRAAIITLLAIYKAGGILVPIPIDCPIYRVKSIIRQTQAELIITEKDVLYNIKSINPELIQTTTLEYVMESRTNSRSESLAYIMFTSGSTGEPKGIMVNQKSVINIAYACYKRFFGWTKETCIYDLQNNVAESMTIAILADFSFDPSIVQLFMGLFFGNCVVPVPDGIKRSQWQLSSYLSQMQVDCMDITPSHLKHILSFYDNGPKDLFLPKFIVSVGEPLTIELLKWLKKFDTTDLVINAYGPTEICVYCTAKSYKVSACEKLTSVTLGKALDGYEIYILDADGKEVNVGETGEICVASPFISLGYIGKDELTKKSFVRLPLISRYMIYRTNDLGFKDDDGEILCRGRADDQIKIAGHRIEIGEIEEVIKAHTSIKNIKVLVSQSQVEEKKLITFYTGQKQVDKYFVNLLKEYLPTAMIPKTYIYIDEIPLNANGKIDRKKLLEFHENTYVINNDNSVENIIAEILNLQEVSLEDNFFEKGATSLDMFLFNTKIYNLYGVLMDNEKLLNCRTIGDIKELVNCLMLDNSNHVELKGKASVLCSEFICQIIRSETKFKKMQNNDEVLPPYNIIFKIKLSELLDGDRIKRALKILINRHRILRSCFVCRDEKVYLESVEENKIDFNHFSSDDTFVLVHEIRHFKYNETPLFQVLLIDKDDLTQELILNFHHGIADQISVEIFINELFRVYNGYELPQSKIDYFEYIKMFKSYDNEITKDFWRKYLEQRNKSVGFKGSGENKRMKVNNYEKYGVCKFAIDGDDYDNMNLLLKKYKLNAFTLFSLSLAYLLYKESGQNDLVIGTVLHGRSNHILGASYVIGMLAQMLPIRFIFDEEESFHDMIINAKRNIEGVLKHQDIELCDIYLMQSFEERLKGEYFKIIVNYNEGVRLDNNLFEGEIQSEELGENIGQIPLYLYICKKAGVYSMTIKYALSIYHSNDVEDISQRYIENMRLFM